ncbi:hypothetical protein GGR54DRAFT_306243 [Hypoxylon sp. NC1633]|nr:hypothetical protein GGR54DRAFT_306243 [Hypoxylon sp. NC1633]
MKPFSITHWCWITQLVSLQVIVTGTYHLGTVATPFVVCRSTWVAEVELLTPSDPDHRNTTIVTRVCASSLLVS